jgi:hypothetical protein
MVLVVRSDLGMQKVRFQHFSSNLVKIDNNIHIPAPHFFANFARNIHHFRFVDIFSTGIYNFFRNKKKIIKAKNV